MYARDYILPVLHCLRGDAFGFYRCGCIRCSGWRVLRSALPSQRRSQSSTSLYCTRSLAPRRNCASWLGTSSEWSVDRTVRFSRLSTRSKFVVLTPSRCRCSGKRYVYFRTFYVIRVYYLRERSVFAFSYTQKNSRWIKRSVTIVFTARRYA